MARLYLSFSTKCGGLPWMKGILDDVLISNPGVGACKLLVRIETKKKRLEKRERQKFSSDFAFAISAPL